MVLSSVSGFIDARLNITDLLVLFLSEHRQELIVQGLQPREDTDPQQDMKILGVG